MKSRPFRRAPYVGPLLAAILLFAAGLRSVGTNWDDGHHLHPDERFITMVAARIQLPSSIDEYFNTAQSPLNPYNKEFGTYIYGTFPLFFVRGMAELIQAVTAALPIPTSGPAADFFRGWRTAAGYGEITLVGRGLSVIADLATIFLLFLIGRRLYGVATGLLAAALASFTVLQIQAAHFFTVESPMALLCTLAFYLAVRSSQSTSMVSWALLGVATGLAAATRITTLMLGAVILTGAGILWYRVTRISEDAGDGRYLWEDILTGLGVAGVVTLVTFRIAQPYAFAGPGLFDFGPNPKYLADVETWQRFATGEADYPPSHQWAGAPPYVWQLTNMTLWGMGPPLAIAAWLGFLLAAFQVYRDPRRHHMHLLALVWVGLNFAYWGIQFAKPMRYLLPIYPQLTLFAAFFIIQLWAWAWKSARTRELPLRSWAPVLQVSAVAGTGVVIGWTFLYSLAFASIYTRPTTRVAASEWIYANVPAGSRIAWEHWDDPLPLRIAGKEIATTYKGVELPLYNEDNVEKRDLIISKLEEADFIVLSSNRLYGSIPKIPQRYPMTTRYYQALFAGELGFERVAEFISRPGLFGLRLPDDDAEEVFTVIDHPKVTILRKGANYSTARVRSILESVSLDNVLKGLKPIHVRSTGLLLSPAQWAADRDGGTWRTMFDRASLANAAPLVFWYLAVFLLGLVALPLTWWVGHHLADGGWPLAKTIAVLAIAYVPWLLASVQLAPYTRQSIGLAVVLLALGSGAVLVTRGRTFVREIAQRARTIVAMEALFLVVFLGFVAIRAANPDLWHSSYGGEKPMDFAYLNAVIKTTWFPPYDPWFAGGYINYYYFGQVVVASLAKLTGIVPWVAFNLAIPTIAALTAALIASVVYNLLIRRAAAPWGRRAWALGAGALGVVLALVGGNLHGFVQVVDWLGKLDGEPVQSSIPGMGVLAALRGMGVWLWSGGSRFPPFNFDFWGPTRVISTESTIPITEFPYFTFLYGDLHAHMIAMPFGLLAVALALNLVRQPDWLPDLRGRSLTDGLRGVVSAALSPGALSIGLAAVTVGVLRMTNSWDYPTYLGLVVVAIFLSEARRPGRQWGRVMVRSVALAGVVFVGAEAASSPYTRSYQLFYTGFEISKFQTTGAHYLIIMGSFLGAVAVYLAFQFSALRERLARAGLGVLAMTGSPAAAQSITADVGAARPVGAAAFAPLIDRLAVAGGAVVLFLAGLLLIAGIPVVGIAAIGIAALATVAVLRRPDPAIWFTFLLAVTALAINAGVEILVLKGDIGRMNTVFKFYLQAWLFLAMASAVLLGILARRAWGSQWLLRDRRRVAVLGGVALLLALTLIYPLLGTPAKLKHRFVPLPASLDGMAYMAYARYADEAGDNMLPDDFLAINWMLDHISGTPIIVEGLSPLYHWRSRVSVYTGLPTIIGWDWHQKVYRGDFAYMVDDRVRDVGTIFTSPSPQAVRVLLDKYKVEYVYVGGLERGYYPREGIEKFEHMVGSSLERVYQAGVVTIYRVVRHPP